MEERNLYAKIKDAQQGDEAAREEIIAGHQVFLRQMVSKYGFGNEDITSRDEYSVALIALNEAIDSYKAGWRSFSSFAAEVIKKRLIDYHRSQRRYRQQVVSLEQAAFYQAGQTRTADIAGAQKWEEQMETRAEIEALVKKLRQHGVELADLIRETPRHADSRRLCIHIARTMAKEEELRRHFIKYGTLPLAGLAKRAGVNTKTVQRHRRYIIALTEILLSDLEILKGYIEQASQGGGNYGD